MSLPETGPRPPTPSSTFFQQLAEPANVLSGLKWGAIVGVAFYAVGLVISLLSVAAASAGPDATKNPVLILPACLALFTIVFAVYVAGYLPAMERGQIAPGLVGALVMIVISTILQSIFRIGGTSSGSGGFGSQAISFILDLVVAGLIGWLGAFYGVKRNAKAEAAKH